MSVNNTYLDDDDNAYYCKEENILIRSVIESIIDSGYKVAVKTDLRIFGGSGVDDKSKANEIIMSMGFSDLDEVMIFDKTDKKLATISFMGIGDRDFKYEELIDNIEADPDFGDFLDGIIEDAEKKVEEFKAKKLSATPNSFQSDMSR